MSSVVDWLSDIAESIIQIPINLIEGILDGLKAILIPNIEDIKENFSNTLTDIQNIIDLPIDEIREDLNNISEQAVQDVNSNYYLHGVGNLNLKFFDSKFFVKGVEFFRPLMRGFIVLLLFFYNYKQLLTFLGQDPAIFHHAVERADNHIKRGGR